jgi:mono/diheme cytochrome c family protein
MSSVVPRWLIVGSLGCGGDRSQNATVTAQTAVIELSDAPWVALGDSIFHGTAAGGTCFTCHGADAKGTQLGPDLTDRTWLNGDGSLAFIRSTVANGVSTPKQHPGPMPSFSGSLSETHIGAVARYVYRLSSLPE